MQKAAGVGTDPANLSQCCENFKSFLPGQQKAFKVSDHKRPSNIFQRLNNLVCAKLKLEWEKSKAKLIKQGENKYQI